MNREHKLALIIGFSLVLVVGVLISDHLSRARLAAEGDVLALDDRSSGEVVRAEPLVPEPNVPLMPGVVFHGGPGEAQIVRDERPILAQAPMPQPVDDRGAFDRRGLSDLGDTVAMQSGGSARPEPLVIAQGRAAGGETVVPDPDRGLIEEISRLGGEVLARGEQLREIRLPTLVERDLVPSDRGDALTREPARADSAVRGTTSAGERPAGSVGTARAEPLRHVVQSGESLYRIAERHLGDGKRWREIARANEGKVDEDGAVRVGVSLIIPGRAASRDAIAPLTPAQPVASTEARGGTARTNPSATPRGERVYVVKSGDTLGKIAQNELGTVKRMKEIVELNKLSDRDTIFVGMRLKLPA